MATHQLAYLSSSSANALISDLRPTTVSPPALHHINLFLDEVLQLLITSTQSINPYHLRLKGIPAAFSSDAAAGESTGLRALGRSAVGEAEVELRSWYELHPTGRTSSGFAPDGKGSGMTADKERTQASFPTQQAVELMRLRCVSFSTLAPQTALPAELEERVVAAWKLAGGDASEDTLAPAGLWMTAVLEHMCEHILSQLSRVVVRDSSISVAGVQDLYTALCEDESIWGMFKRMQVRQSLENAIQSGTRSKRGTPSRSSPKDHRPGRASPASPSPHASRTSLNTQRDSNADHGRKQITPPSAFDSSRTSSDQTPNLSRKASQLKKGIMGRPAVHERSPSVLSVNTRSLLSAFNDLADQDAGTSGSKSPLEDEDEFDALMRSSETMKISLTPSRLKTFDATGRRSAPASPKQPTHHRRVQSEVPKTPPLPSEPLPRSRPQNANLDGTGRNHIPPSSSRTQAGNTPKLTPRAGTTIEEQSGEDDDVLPGQRRPKRETLAELLASGPAEGTPPRGSNGHIKRTAPAVVLGTPPPPAANPDANPPQSLGSRDRDASAQGHAETSGRKRSQAQELADFFNTTAPPPSVTRQDDEPPPTAKSSKFRGFMSKVTGGSKKKDDDRAASITTSSSAGQIDQMMRASGPPQARRQKSMQAFSSNPSLSSNQPENDSPAIPKKSRSTSEDIVKLAPPLDQPIFPIRAQSAKSATPALPEDDRTSEMSDRLSGNHTLVTAGERSSQRSRPSPERQSSRSTLPIPLNGGSVVAMGNVDTEQPLDLSRDEQVELNNQGRLPLESANPDHQQPPDVLRGLQTDAQRMNPLPAVISVTVPSTVSPSASSSSTSGKGSVNESAHVGPGNPATEPVDGSSSQMEPVAESSLIEEQSHEAKASLAESELGRTSIALAELVPLRHLLDHATTATECRLLLSAILTQYGVPFSAASNAIDPETRVAAWLLAGREGPLVPPAMATASSSDTADRRPEHEDDQLLTPTQSPTTELAIPTANIPTFSEIGHGEAAFGGAGEEEELQSESNFSETSMGEEDHVLKTGYMKRIGATVGAGVTIMTSAVGLGGTVGHGSSTGTLDNAVLDAVDGAEGQVRAEA